MTATITYRYLVPDEGPATATWTGDTTDALQAAILALNAEHDGDGWAYHPDELREELAGEPLVVSTDAMVELGAGLCAGHELDALYDPWCASTEILNLDAFGITEEDTAALKDSVLAMVKRAKDRADAELFVATDPVEPWPETEPVDDIPD